MSKEGRGPRDSACVHDPCWRGAGSRRWRSVATVVLLLLALAWPPGCGGRGSDEHEIMLACAASLRRVMPDLLEAYARQGKGPAFVPSYAGSGTLRQQVEAGAPFAGVIFASERHVEMLVEQGLAEEGAVRVVARNQLVLIAGDRDLKVRFRTLDTLPAGERLAIGEPETVPAGRYARDAFQGLGIWSSVRERCVYTHDVAGVLAYVRRGEVAAGVAYATEVLGLSDVHVIETAEGGWAPRPQVVAAPVRGATGAEAVAALLAFLGSADAAAIWQRHGFARP